VCCRRRYRDAVAAVGVGVDLLDRVAITHDADAVARIAVALVAGINFRTLLSSPTTVTPLPPLPNALALSARLPLPLDVDSGPGIVVPVGWFGLLALARTTHSA
jgi:hypothetical protein